MASRRYSVVRIGSCAFPPSDIVAGRILCYVKTARIKGVNDHVGLRGKVDNLRLRGQCLRSNSDKTRRNQDQCALSRKRGHPAHKLSDNAIGGLNILTAGLQNSLDCHVNNALRDLDRSRVANVHLLDRVL